MGTQIYNCQTREADWEGRPEGLKEVGEKKSQKLAEGKGSLRKRYRGAEKPWKALFSGRLGPDQTQWKGGGLKAKLRKGDDIGVVPDRQTEAERANGPKSQRLISVLHSRST